MLRRIFRAPLITSAFFFFWAGAVVFAWVLLPLLVLRHRDKVARRAACRRLQTKGFRLFHGYMHLLGLLRVSVERTPETESPAACVMIANHPTLVDTTAIMSSYQNVTCMVKASLINSIFIGPLLRACGHIAGGDGLGLAGGDAMSGAVAELENGGRLLIFPEGTRSPPGGMHDFRRGAFEIARRARVPILPLFLTCDPPALYKGLAFWNQPPPLIHLAVREKAPVASVDARNAPSDPEAGAEAMVTGPGGGRNDSRALRARVEAQYRFWLYSGVSPTEDRRLPAETGKT